jgi:tRNA-Thr(GGU) m(6)t(6)A37 methyltransferase TsaA
MHKIELTPIGIIHTPYQQSRDIPIQGRFKPDTQGKIEIYEPYVAGLQDLDGFSHAIVIYYFNQSTKETLVGQPYLESEKHGIFAIRSPHRPNHLGLSVIQIEKIRENTIVFSEVDMLDGSPVLDIKPYIKYFENRENTRAGWIEKHFATGNIPSATILK